MARETAPERPGGRSPLDWGGFKISHRVVRTWRRGDSVATLVFGMMQSLDGYVAGVAGGPQMPPPGDQLARHFNDHVRTLAGMVYGRRMYEVMHYWDDDQPEWDAADRDFAMAWRGEAEVGRLTHTQGCRSQRYADPRRRQRVRAQTEGRDQWRDRRRRTGTRRQPCRLRPHRRVSSVLAPLRPRRWQTVLCRSTASTSLRWRGTGW